jgi:hypothetical protein
MSHRLSSIYILFLIFLLSCGVEALKESEKLKPFEYSELIEDYDVLIDALKEAHTGLLRYTTESAFDSIVSHQKELIKAGMTGLDFYNVIAPVISFTKEDHCDLHLSDEVNEFLKQRGLFLPLIVKQLKGEIFILHAPRGHENLHGCVLLKINGREVKEIKEKIYSTFAADGFIQTSKDVFIDGKEFSIQYALTVEQVSSNRLSVADPKTGKIFLTEIASVNYSNLSVLSKESFQKHNYLKPPQEPAFLKLINEETALLYFQTFSNQEFEEAGMNFKSFVDSSFKELENNNISNLIIDLRENGGGSEGNEDYLFSYFAKKPYKKYKHVQLSQFQFSFIHLTDYSDPDDQRELYEELEQENERSSEGMIFRKSGLYLPEPLKEKAFQGKVFILISGWTYSGAAEFCSLMREHTGAVFIGRETGGGFFGNTSGTILQLTLPTTNLKIDIPILKFELDVNKGKFGRGIIPDIETEPTIDEYLSGVDAELNTALKISGKRN